MLGKHSLVFFLAGQCASGAVVLDRSLQPNNPDEEFIDQVMWDNINGADALESLQGLVASFQQSTKEWKAFFMDESPETED